MSHAEAALLAVPHEEAAVRIEHVVGRPAAERDRHLRDAAIAAFDFDETSPTRRLVDRDDHIVERELLAVLLVAEPDVEAELLQDGQHQRAVADHRFELLADLEVRAAPVP